MRWWLVVSSVLVFSAGCVVGVFVARFFPGEGPRTPAGPRGGFFGSSLDTTLQLVSREEVYQELGLTAAQRQKVETLTSEYSENVRNVHRARRQVAKDLEADIARLLTDGQRERLVEIQERYAEEDIQRRASQELARLRDAVVLEPEQENRVLEVLTRASRARRAVWRTEPRPPRETMRQEMAVLRTKRDGELQALLTAKQFEAYRAFKERERSLRRRHGKRRHGGGRPRGSDKDVP